MCAKEECKEARKCVLTPYNMGCCDGATPHHVVPKSQFKERGASTYSLPDGANYNPDKAPCICEPGTSHSSGRHGEIHTKTNNLTVNHPAVLPNVSETGKSIDRNARWKVSDAEKTGAEATATVTKCKPAKCIEDQVRKGHQKMGVNAEDDIRPTTAGSVTEPPQVTSTPV
jgi:hypothetical protein